MNDLQIIIQSPTIISALGTATVIAMGLSGFLYNGFFNRVWRAIAVMIGFAIPLMLLALGLESTGAMDASIACWSIILCLCCSTGGFYYGVWIYRREHEKVKKRGCKNCNLILTHENI